HRADLQVARGDPQGQPVRGGPARRPDRRRRFLPRRPAGRATGLVAGEPRAQLRGDPGRPSSLAVRLATVLTCPAKTPSGAGTGGVGVGFGAGGAGEPFPGRGGWVLPEGIGRLRSIGAPARHMGMSYRRAWLLVRDINDAAGEPLVVAAKGGSQGGGAHLTPR